MNKRRFDQCHRYNTWGLRYPMNKRPRPWEIAGLDDSSNSNDSNSSNSNPSISSNDLDEDDSFHDSNPDLEAPVDFDDLHSDLDDLNDDDNHFADDIDNIYGEPYDSDGVDNTDEEEDANDTDVVSDVEDEVAPEPERQKTKAEKVEELLQQMIKNNTELISLFNPGDQQNNPDAIAHGCRTEMNDLFDEYCRVIKFLKDRDE